MIGRQKPYAALLGPFPPVPRDPDIRIDQMPGRHRADHVAERADPRQPESREQVIARAEQLIRKLEAFVNNLQQEPCDMS